MVSRSQIKLIKSLIQKKYRQQYGLFTVEGVKGITEFLNSSYRLNNLYTTKPVFEASEAKINFISDNELKKISALKNPNTALAVFEIPDVNLLSDNGLIVALDNVRDPGNLGTIIRLCDWFNVPQLVCSINTVDCYNTKVVQATMGSLTRVNVVYEDLEGFLSTTKNRVYGTFMSGTSIYESNLPSEGIIVFGNEANGISAELKPYIQEQITIPQFGSQHATESLNVANACAIILSAFKRNTIER